VTVIVASLVTGAVAHLAAPDTNRRTVRGKTGQREPRVRGRGNRWTVVGVGAHGGVGLGEGIVPVVPPGGGTKERAR